MEPMHWEYMGALGGVIGIGWLVVVPMYRGWNHLNEKMTGRVKQSIRMMAECEDRPVAATTTALPMSGQRTSPGWRRRRPGRSSL
ncbi:hypothetical protein [Variovorax sp. GT1P44]|uniref:hypothetical protein n=1 Tax=Variovorax sp. GT1P44 TaxID=3443742 RepID=UPI003F48A752